MDTALHLIIWLFKQFLMFLTSLSMLMNCFFNITVIIRSNGDSISVELPITDEGDYSVIAVMCGNSLGSAEYTATDHIFSSLGELPSSSFPLIIVFPLFVFFYCIGLVCWLFLMKAEKKRVYYKVFVISISLFIAEYAVLSLFIIVYNWIGNRYPILVYSSFFVVTLIRGGNYCCYLYLTFGFVLLLIIILDMI